MSQPVNQQNTQHADHGRLQGDPQKMKPIKQATSSAKTSKSDSSKPDRSKAKWPLWVGIAVGVILPSILMVGLFRNQNPPISRVVPSASESVAPIAPTTTSSDPTSTIPPVTKMNLMPAEDITPNFVDHVGNENGVRIIYFRDGSKRNLDDFTLQQLPGSTRDSITYSRGGNATP